jgi:hypothetical protein
MRKGHDRSQHLIDLFVVCISEANRLRIGSSRYDAMSDMPSVISWDRASVTIGWFLRYS